MSKPITSIKRLALALCLATPIVSWATPTATAVWRSNLGQSYSIGGHTYSLTIPGDSDHGYAGTLNENGTVTVTNEWTGWASPCFNFGSGVSSVSVLVKFSGLSLPVTGDYGVCIADMKDSSGNEVGAYVAPAATSLSVFHMVDAAEAPTQSDLSDTANAVVESGYMLFSYSTGGGVKVYMGSTIADLVGGAKGDYKFGGGNTISSVSIGGDARGKYYDPCGFTIEEVALFVGSSYAASDVADYVFPTVTVDANVTTMSALNTKVAALDNEFLYSSTRVSVTLDEEPSEATQAYLQGALWNGTVLIKDVDKNNINPTTYGNPNSTLKLSGVKGFFYHARNDTNRQYLNTVTPKIELEDSTTEGREYGFYQANGYSFPGSTNQFLVDTPELKGSGTLKCDSSAAGSTINTLLVVDKWDNFTGKLELSASTVWFGTGLPALDGTDDDLVKAGSVRLGGSIPSNYSTWTVNNGYYGTVEVAANDTNNASDLLASAAWKGTVVVPEATNSTSGHIRIMLAKLGNANSVVQFNGLSSDTKDYYLNAGDSPTYATTVDVNGWVAFANGSSGQTITFSKVTGSNADATLRLAFPGPYSINYTITTLDKFAGTLSVNGYAPLTIGTINLAAAPEAGAKVVKLVNGSYLKNVSSIKVSVNGVVDDTIELEQKDDGLYVVVPVVNVASLGEGEDIVYYTSLTGENGAIAAATPLNRVITLLADVEEAYVLSSGRLKINLNGFTWTGLAAPEGYKIVETPMSGYTQYTVEEDLPVVARIGTVEGQYEYATVEAALQAAIPMSVGTVVYVLVPVSEWKYSELDDTYKDYFNWNSVARTLTRKATTQGEGSATVTAEDAEKACAAVTILPTSAEVKAAMGGVSYETYFQKTATSNGDGTWTVTATLSKTQIFEGDASETAVLTATLDGVLDDTADEITIPAKRGLYYSFKSGDEVTGMTEGDRVLATGSTVTLDKVDGDTFYQVLVNTAPKAAAAND